MELTSTAALLERREWRHQRPLWTVALLAFAWSGLLPLYTLIWFGLTWYEMKRELGKSDMHPWWHAAGLFIPIYSLAVIYEHFARIRDLDGPGRGHVSPGWALIGMIIANVLTVVANRMPSGNPTPLAVGADLVAGLVVAFVLARGQDGLNAYWRGLPDRVVPTRVHWAEWTALLIGLPLSIVFTFAPLTPGLLEG